MNNKILKQNKASWDNMADDWFGSDALPTYGPITPTEDELHLFGTICNKKVLDIGCGSGHSLKWQGDKGAAELWGLDMSLKQLENAEKYLKESGYNPRLINSPMEEDCGLPKDYFDIVYSIYAIGWTMDLDTTFHNIFSYLKKDGIFIFSWDHPFLHCINGKDETLIFDGSYFDEELLTFKKAGNPVSLYNRRMSTYINALAKAGFAIEKLVEETDWKAMENNCSVTSNYYAPTKAKRFPLSFVIKARKL
jgi:cyclopropane fatty-acyl-phospholipid synthase-like methyltransferase